MTGQEMISCWLLVQLLTQEEASSVTINNPNPDFGGPAYAIDVSGEWTGYEDRRFGGDSILECLDTANRDRVAAQGALKSVKAALETISVHRYIDGKDFDKSGTVKK